MRDLQDIHVSVLGSESSRLDLRIPWDDNLDEWANHLKTILVFLGFYVDKIDINPESDDPQEPTEKPDEP